MVAITILSRRAESKLVKGTIKIKLQNAGIEKVPLRYSVESRSTFMLVEKVHEKSYLKGCRLDNSLPYSDVHITHGGNHKRLRPLSGQVISSIFLLYNRRANNQRPLKIWLSVDRNNCTVNH